MNFSLFFCALRVLVNFKFIFFSMVDQKENGKNS